MRMLTQVGFLFALYMFIITSARANLLVEPLAGYNFNYNQQEDVSGSEEYEGHGFAYGGRLGFQKLGFQVGLDYLNSRIDINDKVFKEELSIHEWAAFAGFEFPVLFRVYAGYIFAAYGQTELDNAGTLEKFEVSNGSGAKFGVGFTGLPFIDINLEYRRGTFGEYEQANVKFKEDTNYSSWLVSLSLPFTL